MWGGGGRQHTVVPEWVRRWPRLQLSGLCTATRRPSPDLAPPSLVAPADSESELSVSGFLSVASQSCEEDEGRDSPLLCHPSVLRGPTGMSGEGNHGNQPAQRTGVEKHRWGTLQI